jgi:hypothetical protein
VNKNTNPAGAGDAMSAQFKPLNEGAKFKGKIRFHNLRKVEIGALLSALTFHNHNDKVYHSLGYAKPFGYGKVKLDVLGSKDLKYSFNEYLEAFETEMRIFNPNWDLTSLLQMAIEKDDKLLVYPELKEFQEMKNRGDYLEEYINFNVKFNKLLDDDKIKQEIQGRIEAEKKAAEEAKAQEKERQQKELDQQFSELLKEADNLFEKQEWKEAKKRYLEALKLRQDDEYCKQQKEECDTNIVESGLDELKEIDEFKKGKIIINNYKKKKGITPELFPIIKGFIIRSIPNSRNADIRNIKRGIWRDIKSWVGSDITQEWFNEMIKK